MVFSSSLSRIALATLLVGSAAWRWDATGHKTVARIAWEHMTPRARAGAVRLLRHGPPLARIESLARADSDLFVESATWADVVRDTLAASRGYNHPQWHYADTYWRDSDGKAVPVTGFERRGADAIERLEALAAVLRDPAEADTTRAVALAWVLHLVGDIHQPLHLSNKVSAEHPKGDRGGNAFKLDGPVTNLHAWWDDILDIESPLAAGEDSSHYVSRLAERVQHGTRYASVSPAALHSSVQAWAAESLDLAETAVYAPGLGPDREPPRAYQAASDRVAEQRIALAGYRLAALLNAVFL